VNAVKVNKAIPRVIWWTKTVMFLAKQTGFEVEEKGTDFQKNMMLVLTENYKTRRILMDIF
jgi:hypothetical protein